MPDFGTLSLTRVFCCRASVRTLLLALFLPLWMASSALGMPRNQRHELKHVIDRLEDRWRDAIVKSDTVALGSLLSEDYIAITPWGTLQTKQETLASMRSGRLRITSLTVTDRKVRFYGSTALVTSMALVSGIRDNNPISGYFRYTRVYIRNPQGVWKIVSFEASRVRHPDQSR